MKRKRRIIFPLAVVTILFLFLGAVYVAKDRILTIVLPRIAGRMLGAKVRIEALSLSLPEQSLVIEGLTIYNPPGFPAGIMADVPVIQVKFDADALFRRRLYLPYFKINFQRLNVQINDKQTNNIQALVDMHFPAGKKTLPASPAARNPWSFQADTLVLVLGSVMVNDFSVADKPVLTPYYVFRYQVYENISNGEHIGARLLVEAAKMAQVKGLAFYGVASLDSFFAPIKKAGNYLGLDPLASMVQNNTVSLTQTLFMPYEITEMLMGGGAVKVKFGVPLKRIHLGVCTVLNRFGKITKDNEKKGIIVAKFQDTTISVRLKSVSGGTELTVVATERLKAKPHFARGLVYYLTCDLAKDYPSHSTKSPFMK